MEAITSCSQESVGVHVQTSAITEAITSCSQESVGVYMYRPLQ